MSYKGGPGQKPSGWTQSAGTKREECAWCRRRTLCKPVNGLVRCYKCDAVFAVAAPKEES